MYKKKERSNSSQFAMVNIDCEVNFLIKRQEGGKNWSCESSQGFSIIFENYVL